MNLELEIFDKETIERFHISKLSIHDKSFCPSVLNLNSFFHYRVSFIGGVSEINRTLIIGFMQTIAFVQI